MYTKGATNRAKFRDELIKEWDTLIQHVEESERKSSSSCNQKNAAVPKLDLSAILTAQKTITAPVGNKLFQATRQATTTSTSSITTTTASSRPVAANEKLDIKQSPRDEYPTQLIFKDEDSSGESSSSSTKIRRTDSPRSRRQEPPRKNECYPNSSRVRSPSATEKENKSSSQDNSQTNSQANSPATTPRGDKETQTSNTLRTPRGSALRSLRKKVSKHFSDIDLAEISSSVKNAASSVKEALSPNSTPRKQSPRAQSKEEHLASISFASRNSNAEKIARLQETDEFKRKSVSVQIMLMHASLLEDLSADSPLRCADGLKLLLDDAKLRNKNAQVDTVLDLNDPSFSTFVKQAADGAFAKPWEKDSSDVDSELKSYLSKVKNTFARDFANSNYQVQEQDGSLRKLKKIDEFIEYVEADENQGLAMVVSNIASQNLGNFLKNSLFLRQDANGVSQSLLKLFDGTPIVPQAIAKASYVLSKDKNGVLSLDYTWESSKTINGDKGIRARELGGNSSTFAIENPSLNITVRVSIAPNGEWTIQNPHLHAEGWNHTPDR